MNAKFFLTLLATAALPAFAFNYETLVKNAESTDGKAPISSIWQEKNKAALDAATAEDVIAAFTDSEEAAQALLARVKPAYATDPLVSYQIAEVTHWVMVDSDASWYEFWREHRGDRRRLWAESLLRTAEKAADEYVQIFCLDQLRWCGCACQADRIRRLGVKSTSNGVREFVCWVIRELTGRTDVKLAPRTANGITLQDPERVAEIAAMLPEKPGLPLAQLSNRAAWDKLAATTRGKAAVKAAERTMKAPIPDCPDALYLEFSTPGNGNRTHYEKPFFQRESSLKTLTLGECLENKGRFVPKICDYLNALCVERTWIMPAHDRKLDAFHNRRQWVDLGAQSRAFACAYTLDILKDKLPADVKARTRAELERRIFAPMRSVWVGKSRGDFGGGSWFQGRANWTAVCHAGVTRAALAVLEDRMDRAAFIEGAERSVPTFLSGFTDDGYCSEGMGYWCYGWGHFLQLTLAVREATGGRVDFCDSAKAKKAMEFGTGALLLGETAPSFADGGGSMDYHIMQLGHLVWPELPVVARAQKRDPLEGNVEKAFLMDFGQWESVPAPQVGDYPIRTPFPYAQMWVLRPGASDMPFRMGLKGGNNAEFHNHNDIGSYMLYLDGGWLTGDAGGTQYTAKTFSAQRYEITMLNSYGHPLPVLNGALQSAGKDFAAKTVKTEFTDARDTIVLDLTGAYDRKQAKVRSLVRTFVYDRAAKSVTVSDTVAFEGEGTFSVPLILAGAIEKTDKADVYRLTVGKGEKTPKPLTATVEVSTGGAAYALTSEKIENPPRISPNRHAFTLTKPVASATVSFTFRR